MAVLSQGLSVVFAATGLASQALRGPKRVVLDTIEIDCTVSESIEYSAEVSEFEVESGANITDHRRTKPVEISINGVISDTPLDQRVVQQAIQVASLGFSNVVDDVQALAAGAATLSSTAFEKLVQLFESGSRSARNPDGTFNAKGSIAGFDGTFTIVSKYRTYPNMTITSLRFQREKGTGYALPFTASFRQIRRVASAISSVVQPPFVQSPLQMGDQSTKDGPDFNFDIDTVGVLDKLMGGKFTKFAPTPSGPK